MAVEREIRHVAESLSFCDEAVPATADLEPLLNRAASAVNSAGESLASVKNSKKEVQEHKIKVIDLLRTLDSRINQLRGLLPCPAETTPVSVDTCKSWIYAAIWFIG